MGNLLEQAGAKPNRDAKFVPLFMDRAFTGIYTQRSPLRDPSDWATSKFYGGRPDALIDGLNVELTNKLTLQRRPGLVQFSTAVYPTPPNRAYDFQLTDGTIRVIVDTGSTGALTVTAVADSTSGTAVYTGTFPDGGLDAYVGMYFTIAGFANTQNNGTYIVTASTTTTLTLANATAVAETLAATAISTGAVYYDSQDGNKTLLFGKAAGAGQTHFVAVAGVLYMGDGVEVKKYTPNNPNGTIWNWGIDAPTTAPSLQVVTTGAAATEWQASTFFSTMGVIIDDNGAAQQLITVNYDGTNPNSQFGLSSAGVPAWNHSIGGLTPDGTGGGAFNWRNIGTLLPWASTTTYANFAYARDNGSNTITSAIFDAASNAIYLANPFANTNVSGLGKPAFNGVPGSTYTDGPFGLTWICIGTVASHSWVFGTPVTNLFSVTEYPTNPTPDQTSFIHMATGNGTTGSAGALPNWGTEKGQFTADNQLAWINLTGGTNSATWTQNTSYESWTDAADQSFAALEDSNGNLQICITAGVSGGVEPTWATGYGSITDEVSGGVRWANAGAARNWNRSKSYHLPVSGFSPSTSSTSFGGSAVSDSNGNIQYTVQSGLSGLVEPTWDPDIGELTADNEILWYNNGPFNPNSFSWSTSLAYVYSFKSRTSTDPYNTTAPPLWMSATQPQALGPYKGSGTGAVSSASPQAIINTGNPGAVVIVTLQGSIDPQVDTLEVFRTTDGGSTFLFLTDIPNPAPVAGAPGTIKFTDYMQDTPTPQTATSPALPGLNPFLPAPIGGVNDPPDDAFLPMAFNFQRIWGGVGSSIFFSGGPDTLVGNPNEAFDKADKFPFLAQVVRAVKTTRGLVVFLTNSVELIAGGPQTASFFSVTLAPGVGLQSYNALDVYGGEIFFFSSDAQFKVLSPELQLANFGFPIGDQFANATAGSHVNNWSSSTVYVAVLQAGLDSAIFVADGATGWFRLNPRQIPGGFSGPEPIWSPFAAITNGCKMVQTIEVRPGIKKLLVGSDDPSRTIWQRDLSVFTDIGDTYDSWFTMGSIMLANPGQLALLKFIEADFSGVAYKPTVSFLLNEIAGTFYDFTQNPVYDPPQVYGKTITPTSYSPNRYYFTGEETLARCRHLQIKVDFGQTDDGDELFNLTIFGRLVVEP